MLTLEKQLLAAYDASDRNIPDSDLDDEQPISITIRTTLGDVRSARRRIAMVERGAKLVEADLKARDEYDANL